jgi:hypothetical protein
MTRDRFTHAFVFAFIGLAALACTASTTLPSGVLAINLRTGETRTFEDAESVPEGWATCDADMTCPEPSPCESLDESACIVRTDCDPFYAEDPPDSPTPYRGCASLDCDSDACGPLPGAPAIMCDDGSIGGSTGRCLRGASGTCGWEIRECPAECTETECGPAPGAPNFMCADGSWGGPGPCARNADGVCGYGFRDCPPAECAVEDCGPAPGAEPRCADGTGATTVCTNVDGVCGWQFECGGCGPLECGPAPGVGFVCPDGSTASTVCEPSAAGTCGWQFICPGE